MRFASQHDADWPNIGDGENRGTAVTCPQMPAGDDESPRGKGRGNLTKDDHVLRSIGCEEVKSAVFAMISSQKRDWYQTNTSAGNLADTVLIPLAVFAAGASVFVWSWAHEEGGDGRDTRDISSLIVLTSLIVYTISLVYLTNVRYQYPRKTLLMTLVVASATTQCAFWQSREGFARSLLTEAVPVAILLGEILSILLALGGQRFPT